MCRVLVTSFKGKQQLLLFAFALQCSRTQTYHAYRLALFIDLLSYIARNMSVLIKAVRHAKGMLYMQGLRRVPWFMIGRLNRVPQLILGSILM